MIRAWQKRVVGQRGLKTLDRLWFQHLSGHLARIRGDAAGERAAERGADTLRAKLVEQGAPPAVVIAQWEQGWDAWLDEKLAWMERS